jgi:uncharacterized membrane protein YedE/YeeE
MDTLIIAVYQRPWPWYIAGPLIGLAVPALLLAGNKGLGVSSSLRDICAACVPANVRFLHYDWKKNSWNLFFVAGILIGGFIAGTLFANPLPVAVSPATVHDLHTLGVSTAGGLMPRGLFNWHMLGSLKGLILMVAGGFMVGFGTRYAGGCTSGHGIFGLSTLQWPSLVAVTCFFAGGILCTWLILPYVLSL